jgi:hypothetical protein
MAGLRGGWKRRSPQSPRLAGAASVAQTAVTGRACDPVRQLASLDTPVHDCALLSTWLTHSRAPGPDRAAHLSRLSAVPGHTGRTYEASC